jgi:cysteine desulfurase
MPPVYLDYNASTPIDPAVAAAMRPLLETAFGNPSSGHWASGAAKSALDHARGQVAALLGASADEVVFTSGGSEANNLALKGAFFARRDRGSHIITTSVEHPAVLRPCQFLEKLGATLTILPVDRFGRVDPDAVRQAITSRTILISVMHANNEVGTIQPLAEIAALARAHGVLFHTDAAQSVGKISTRVDELGVDLLTVVGHKMYAPKGVGALYVRRGITLEPLIHGAGHELGRRAGTESALLASGLGAACALAQDLSPMAGVRALRDRLWNHLQTTHGDCVVLNGHPEFRLPNTLNVSFVGRIGGDVLHALGDVAASTGSACHSGQVELSPVLKAMGVPPEIGLGAVRFSLGRGTTEAEIDAVAERLHQIVGANNASVRSTSAPLHA